MSWVHPLARTLTSYRVFGKGHVLPGWWFLCADCESLYKNGDDAELARLSVEASEEAPEPAELYDGGVRPFTGVEWFQQVVAQPIGVFRRADMGARPVA